MWSIFLILSHNIRLCSVYTHNSHSSNRIQTFLLCQTWFVNSEEQDQHSDATKWMCMYAKANSKDVMLFWSGRAKCFRWHFMFTFGMSLLISIFGVAFCLNRSMCKLICAKGNHNFAVNVYYVHKIWMWETVKSFTYHSRWI